MRYEERRVVPPNFEALYNSASILQVVPEEAAPSTEPSSAANGDDLFFNNWTFVNEEMETGGAVLE